MKFKLFSILIIGILFLFSCQQDLVEQEPEIEPAEKSGIVCEENTVITIQIKSKWLANNLLSDPATRNVNIYLPKGYNKSNKRYPVIYLLHGQPATENSLFAPEPFMILKAIAQLQFDVDFPPEGFVQWLNNLTETGGMKDVIIVMTDATNKFGFSHYSNSPAHGNYEKYITHDLVKYVDSQFKTIPTPKARAVVGHCMGGYGALRLAIKYPYIFRNVAGLTPVQYSPTSVLICAQLMKLEEQMWDFQGPTLPYSHYAPYKFFTNAMYGACAAWLPNPDNPPYYLDLPFIYAADGTPIMNDELMDKWNSQNLMGLVQTYQNKMRKLNSIYFDVGMYDELGLTNNNVELHQLMESLEIPHEFEMFEGGHMSHVYDRLGNALIDLSEKISQPCFND